MANNYWMLDVVSDLTAFARSNEFPETHSLLVELRSVLIKELTEKGELVLMQVE